MCASLTLIQDQMLSSIADIPLVTQEIRHH
jgi:hypothetical protein